VSLDHLLGWDARLSGRVILFRVDRPGPLWTGSLVENPDLVGQAYPVLE
jgi:hypothetical protein